MQHKTIYTTDHVNQITGLRFIMNAIPGGCIRACHFLLREVSSPLYKVHHKRSCLKGWGIQTMLNRRFKSDKRVLWVHLLTLPFFCHWRSILRWLSFHCSRPVEGMLGLAQTERLDCPTQSKVEQNGYIHTCDTQTDRRPYHVCNV